MVREMEALTGKTPSATLEVTEAGRASGARKDKVSAFVERLSQNRGGPDARQDTARGA